jgi:hypothetical protein
MTDEGCKAGDCLEMRNHVRRDLFKFIASLIGFEISLFYSETVGNFGSYPAKN